MTTWNLTKNGDPDRGPPIPIYYIRVIPKNITWLWKRCRHATNLNPESELYILRLDMMIAFTRYGRDYKKIADYLRGGRDWGPL